MGQRTQNGCILRATPRRKTLNAHPHLLVQRLAQVKVDAGGTPIPPSEPHIVFALCTDKGDLEAKTVLLVESLRKWAGSLRDAPIWVVQTQRKMQITDETLEALRRSAATFRCAGLDVKPRGLRFAHKVFAAAYVEEHIRDPLSTIVVLDSDVICVNPPERLLLSGDIEAAVSAVSNKGVGVGVQEGLPEHWRIALEACDADASRLWQIGTGSEDIPIWAHFNSGLVAARRSAGVFARWKKNLVHLAETKFFKSLKYPNPVRREMDQIALTCTLLNFGKERLDILPTYYNYDLRGHVIKATQGIYSGTRISNLNEAVFVHYGNKFGKLDWLEYVGVDEQLRSWLLERLPLPYIPPTAQSRGDTRGWARRSVRRLLRRMSGNARARAPHVPS